MLNTIFFLSDKPALLNKEMQHCKDCKIYFSFLSDGENNEIIEKAYRFFSENQENPFSLSIILNSRLSNNALERIISFFFIPSYHRIGSNIMLTLITDSNDFFENAKKRLTDFSFEQGIENIIITRIRPYNMLTELSVDLQKRINFIYSDIATLLTDYTTILKSENIFGHIFYLNSPDSNPYDIYRSLQKIEENIKTEKPQTFVLADTIQSISAENEYLKKKNHFITRELENYKGHNEILRSSHEAKVLQEYYQKEYETLPLWYKRFGHLIKVVMGKRTFRSLFNDNVKKYKD